MVVIARLDWAVKKFRQGWVCSRFPRCIRRRFAAEVDSGVASSFGAPSSAFRNSLFVLSVDGAERTVGEGSPSRPWQSAQQRRRQPCHMGTALSCFGGRRFSANAADWRATPCCDRTFGERAATAAAESTRHRTMSEGILLNVGRGPRRFLVVLRRWPRHC